MDVNRFDRLTVALARRASRRTTVALLSGLSLTSQVAQPAAAQTCLLEDGQPCDPQANNCCSGRCKRKRHTHKHVCQAVLGQGTCTVDQDNCVGSTTFNCNGDVNCACYVSTRGWSVCGDGRHGACAICEQDKQCNTVTGKGSRCVPCASVCSSGTLCIRPCAPAA